MYLRVEMQKLSKRNPVLQVKKTETSVDPYIKTLWRGVAQGKR